MNICIKQTIQTWLAHHPKLKQWLWFIGLWCVGLLSVTVLTYPLKVLVKLAS